MGRRQRRRAKGEADLSAALPNVAYTDASGNSLTLRARMSAATRREYAEVLAGFPLSREDAWHRATEFLFERLAVHWVIADIPVEGQRELLARFRFASREERQWVRETLREHCAKHFPELNAP